MIVAAAGEPASRLRAIGEPVGASTQTVSRLPSSLTSGPQARPISGRMTSSRVATVTATPRRTRSIRSISATGRMLPPE